MNCTDCTRAASTWNWHGYRNACPDCQIRAIAQAPRHLRELRYDQIRRKDGIAAAHEAHAAYMSAKARLHRGFAR